MTYAWQDIGNGRSVYRKVETIEPKRSALPCPMVISDTMDAIQHPCDGRRYDSKANFRSTTRAHNCEEVGNDPARLKAKPKPKPDRKAIRESLMKAKAQLS
jgi:hypothetical protein